jgi:hypothetical protein
LSEPIQLLGETYPFAQGGDCAGHPRQGSDNLREEIRVAWSEAQDDRRAGTRAGLELIPAELIKPSYDGIITPMTDP